MLLTEEALLQDLLLRLRQRCWYLRGRRCCLPRERRQARGRAGQQSSPRDGLRSSSLQASLSRRQRRGYGIRSGLRHTDSALRAGSTPGHQIWGCWNSPTHGMAVWGLGNPEGPPNDPTLSPGQPGEFSCTERHSNH